MIHDDGLQKGNCNYVDNSNISFYMENVEKMRKRFLAILYILYFSVLIFAQFDIYYWKTFFDLDEIEFICFSALGILLFLCFILCINYLLLRHFKKKTKKIIFSMVFSQFEHFLVENKNVNHKVIEQYVKGLDIIPRFNNFACDDHITGKYRGVNTSISELNLLLSSSKYSQVIFNGIMITCEALKPVKGSILIKHGSMFNFDFKRRIRIDSSEFEKKFDVYADSESEVRSIITPEFVVGMLKLIQKPFAKKIFMSFENGMVNIFIPSSKDWFEISMRKSVYDVSSYKKIQLELERIFLVIDLLIMNQCETQPNDLN